MHNHRSPASPDMIELNSNLYTQFARARAFLPQQVLGFLLVLKLLFEEFLCWCTRPVEVFFRRRFGVRGHSLFQTMQLSLLGLCLFSLLVTRDPLLALFALASAGLSIYHLVETVRWEKYGTPPRYTWSHGEPIPLWAYAAGGLRAVGVDPARVLTVEFVCRFGEPLVCLLLALVLSPSRKRSAFTLVAARSPYS